MNIGDHVSDFSLADEMGAQRSLKDLLAGGPVVLFFYPAAMTSGCTKESCHFRDLKGEFEALGAQRVGISADTIDKQRAFSAKHSFDFPLLSDVDHRVARMFGVKRTIGILPNKRVTFVIDTDGTVLSVVNSEMHMETHADRALEALRHRG